MKFIFLANGKIANKVLLSPDVQQLVGQNMLALVASKAILENLPPNVFHLDEQSIVMIGDKESTEAKIQSLIDKYLPDYVLSVQYPWILSKRLINSMKGKILNLHNAELPKYRGHNTISHEILNNEERHISTLHWIVEKVDMGKIVMTRDIEIYPDDTAQSLWQRSAESSLFLMRDWFTKHVGSCIENLETDIEPGGNFFPKDIERFKIIPKNASPEVINRWARAFWFPPFEPAYSLINGQKTYVVPGSDFNQFLKRIQKVNE